MLFFYCFLTCSHENLQEVFFSGGEVVSAGPFFFLVNTLLSVILTQSAVSLTYCYGNKGRGHKVRV